MPDEANNAPAEDPAITVGDYVLAHDKFIARVKVKKGQSCRLRHARQFAAPAWTHESNLQKIEKTRGFALFTIWLTIDYISNAVGQVLRLVTRVERVFYGRAIALISVAIVIGTWLFALLGLG